MAHKSVITLLRGFMTSLDPLLKEFHMTIRQLLAVSAAAAFALTVSACQPAATDKAEDAAADATAAADTAADAAATDAAVAAGEAAATTEAAPAADAAMAPAAH